MIIIDNLENLKNENIINKIKKLEEELPNLTIPTMGIVDIKNNVDINGKDYLKQKSVKED